MNSGIKNTALPLNGITVLEFSQYLSGPAAGLRLADLGARVIKIERPVTGDACRKLAIKNLWVEESSLVFNTINRNKESFSADLKNNDDLELVKQLIAKADVVTHNFRPGVMEKIGLGYQDVERINPLIVYAAISGYGKQGPWKDKPGQDLLVQSLSGLVYTSGNKDANPVPFGLAIADMFCGAHLVQGILAALIRRQKTGIGALVEVSLMESILDFQFELLTTYFASHSTPQRGSVNNAHPLLSAPYGVYETADGFIAIAMAPIQSLADALSFSPLKNFGQDEVFTRRDEIKTVLASLLKENTSGYWFEKLLAAGIWAMPLLDWKDLTAHKAYQAIEMEQLLSLSNRKNIKTTRCPIRLNEQILTSAIPAPKVGEHTQKILAELKIQNSL